ncbi:hypothetical protein PAXINDRAFT_18423 [Paxillus involutus ATCC 200175]|uniref:Uncharacterized protein n=1 Tax=Paxillus involutus ATCC 200175 TaxID=664439 RepID=A0A0C9TKW6_PAXIN|nr:hypothetical protein PAXINDRAFT_18423 [Paxillus involutus ATCC 200175]
MEPANKITTNQPQAAMQMSIMNPAPGNNAQNHQAHHHAKRIRGGGAVGECFSGLMNCLKSCITCGNSECCNFCGSCAGIICCPCEMCC